MISAVLFLIQMTVLAVTDGPKLVRRLRNPSERWLRWRTLGWVIIIATLLYAVAIDNMQLGIFLFGWIGLLQLASLWSDSNYANTRWMRGVRIFFTVCLVLFSICAWSTVLAFYLGWQPE